jgi:hypothetical protein
VRALLECFSAAAGLRRRVLRVENADEFFADVKMMRHEASDAHEVWE